VLTFLVLLACTPQLTVGADTGGVAPTDTTGTVPIDSGDETCLLYLDQDSDGWGVSDQTTDECDASGYSEQAGDCDDYDAAINPDADEVCNALDDDCDDRIDEGDIEPATWYQDLDLDGYGTATATRESCEQPDGYAKTDDDCNDIDSSIHPYADEVCDEIDQDCDKTIDENALDAHTWYADVDQDGYGDAASPLASCELPEDYCDNAGDCDDADGNMHPNATETCDNRDEDCDGSVDENAVDAGTWYLDSDNDGYGDPHEATVSCTAPSGTVEGSTDCDDDDASIHPGVTETCDTVDQDCDGSVDEGLRVTWYLDSDGDTYGDPTTGVEACAQPSSSYVESAGDCYDSNGDAYPGQTSYFDNDRGDKSFDYDCDGTEEQEYPDFSSCSESAGGNCNGSDGWWDYYGTMSTVPECGEEWYWELDCEMEDLWGWEYCDHTDYEDRDQNCR
jgi:hypothetical protein